MQIIFLADFDSNFSLSSSLFPLVSLYFCLFLAFLSLSCLVVPLSSLHPFFIYTPLSLCPFLLIFVCPSSLFTSFSSSLFLLCSAPLPLAFPRYPRPLTHSTSHFMSSGPLPYINIHKLMRQRYSYRHSCRKRREIIKFFKILLQWRNHCVYLE